MLRIGFGCTLPCSRIARLLRLATIVLHLAAVTVLTVRDSHAVPLFTQPRNDPFTMRTSQFLVGFGFGFTVFDDFSIGSGGSVETVTWEGAYFNSLNGPANPPAPNSISFTIQFFTDDALNPGNPGSVLAEHTFLAADVNETLVGVQPGTSVGGGLVVDIAHYSYEVALATVFTADPGAKYWIRIYETSEVPSVDVAQWAWLSSVSGDLRSLQYSQGTLFGVSDRDRAFALQGQVPEPATVFLLGLGLAGGAYRRRAQAGK